jgi:hypothetical protein
MVLVEREEDERVLAVDARVGEEREEPVFKEGGGEVDGGVVCVVDLWMQMSYHIMEWIFGFWNGIRDDHGEG